jgi:hypothetical protein
MKKEERLHNTRHFAGRYPIDKNLAGLLPSNDSRGNS